MSKAFTTLGEVTYGSWRKKKFISEDRLIFCRISAATWTKKLPDYIADMRGKRDFYAMLSATLGVITGLGVWSTLVASAQWYAQFIVSSMAFLAALAVIVPKTKGYAECAAVAAVLCPRYANVMGDFIDVLAMFKRSGENSKEAQDAARHAVSEFEAIKREKDEKLRFSKKFLDEVEEKRRQLRAKHHSRKQERASP
jgi:hypothetical protein